jgi:hypothetical protein
MMARGIIALGEIKDREYKPRIRIVPGPNVPTEDAP